MALGIGFSKLGRVFSKAGSIVTGAAEVVLGAIQPAAEALLFLDDRNLGEGGGDPDAPRNISGTAMNIISQQQARAFRTNGTSGYDTRVHIPGDLSQEGGIFDSLDLDPFDDATPAQQGVRGVPATVVAPQQKVCNRCPRGYVLITDPVTRGQACILKCVAVQLKLWKARRKPPMSAADWRTMQVASRVEKKVKRMASMAGFVCATKGSRRRKK